MMVLRISVALCTYEGERYLPEQLESLLAQERPPDELVVSDDGSTDDTVAILEDFAARAPFPVRIHRNTSNLGPTKNFEQAIGMCTGDAIALCDQDDVWLPPKLARFEEVFDATPEAGLAFSDTELVDEDGNDTGRRLWGAVGLDGQMGRDGLLGVLLGRRVVTGATLVFRTELRGAVCPLPEAWPHDAWVALVGALVAPCRMLPEPLIRYRLHEGQWTGISRNRHGPSWDVVLSPSASQDERKRRAHRSAAERYDALLDRIEALEDSGCLRDPASASRVKGEAAELFRHHRMRAALPSSRLRRVPIVVRELRTGGYRRLARGTLSAVKDLVS